MSNVVVYVVTSWSNLPSQTSPLDATALNHIETGIKNVTDFINTLNANEGLYLCGAPYTSAEKTKLAGIEAQANKYVLPAATTSALGGVKVDGTTITISNGVISSTVSASALANLTDVEISDLANGQILKYDAQNSKWVNATQEEIRTQLSQLTDVELTDLTDGQIIAWDATEQKWVNVDNSGGGGDVLDYDETLETLGLPVNPLTMGEETILWTNPGSTNPSGIVLSENWTHFKTLLITGTAWNSSINATTIVSGYNSVAVLKAIYDDNKTPVISAIDNQTAYVGYKITGLNQLTLSSANTYVVNSIIGYK